MNIDISKIRKEIKDNGYCICKNLIDFDDYIKAREELIRYFKKICNFKNTLPKPLRGNVGAGMKDIVGKQNNKNWYLVRGCFFPWNEIENDLRETILVSRRLSKIRNKLNYEKEVLGKINKDGYSRYFEFIS